MRRQFVSKKKPTPPPVNQPPVNQRWPMIFPLLALSLAGCKTLPEAPVRIPAQPQLTQPLPLQTYSSSVQQDFKTWQQRLMDTQTTSEP